MKILFEYRDGVHIWNHQFCSMRVTIIIAPRLSGGCDITVYIDDVQSAYYLYKTKTMNELVEHIKILINDIPGMKHIIPENSFYNILFE